jgi:two-component system chemotaxis sensor kinase CheA
VQEDDDIIREFLIESNENLNRLDTEIVDLERHPTAERLASIFRTIHTIKGTCGFLGFEKLEGITHHAENILSQLRAGQRQVSGNLVSVILESVDAVRQILNKIESTGQEGDNSYPELVGRLERTAADTSSDAAAVAGSEAATGSEAAAGSEAAVAMSDASVGMSDAAVAMSEAAAAMSDAAVAADRAAAAGSKAQASEAAEPHLAASAPVAPHAAELAAHSAATPAPAAKPAAAAKPAPASAPPPAPEIEKSSNIADSSIRVDVSLLDKLMNLVGELVLARNQILQFTNQHDDTGLNATSQRLNLITSELQEGVMKTRMQPIGMIWNKLPRVVRDVAHSLGKQLELVMEGAETELDKTIIEAIKDPLTHMVRNACDHGVEDPETRMRKGKPAKGTLKLKAYHEGGQVNIEISDDGAGIDAERVKRKAVEKGLIRAEQAAVMSEREAIGLLFLAGFSTAQTVTNVSGRGVGMDVVKSNVEKIGGAVDIATKLGEGTTVKLKIPLTLAIIPGLLVTIGGHRFVIPQVSLLELIRLEGDALSKIEYVHQAPVYRRRGALLPIAYLNEVLRLPPTVSEEAKNIVVLQAEERQFGLVVDGVNDTQEIVVKPMGKQLKGLTCYSGSTIMGDGAVALILDVLGIGQLSGVLNRTRESHRQDTAELAAAQAQKQRLLLFKSGSFERLAVPLSLVARLEEIPLSSVEYAGGRRVVQYRDQILPLIALSSIIESSFSDEAEGTDPIQVVVFSNEDNTMGLIVDQIIDIVEESVTMRRSNSPRRGILGSAVVGKKVADFLDLQSIIETTGEKFFGAPESRSVSTVLLAESSAFNRGLLRSQLEMSGYAVLEAGSTSEALQRVEREPVQIVVIGSDLVSADAAAMEKVRKRTVSARIPILALGNARGDKDAGKYSGLLYDDYQLRFEREAMLASIARLAMATGEARLAEMERAGELVHA